MRGAAVFIWGMLIGDPTMAGALSAGDLELLTTRTTSPQPSSELIRALELDVPDWHKKGVPEKRIKIGEDAARRSTEAALQALTSVDPAIMQNDFDRAWVKFETGAALKALGRNPEARAIFEGMLTMPRTNIMDRRVLAELYILGDEQRPGWCPSGHFIDSWTDSRLFYPKLASSRGIEGWVEAWLDVMPDGSIAFFVVHSSSMRVFERPAVEWLSKRRWQADSRLALDRPCFASVQINFEMKRPGQTALSIEQIGQDTEFSYRSVGAAIRVRAAAREAALESRE